jgi:hypothetical protein
MVAALWRKRADEVEPTSIETAFRHCILDAFHVSRSWNSLFCWHIADIWRAHLLTPQLFVGHTAKLCSGFPDRTHQNIKTLMKCPSATQAWIFATGVSIHTLHINMSAILLQSPSRAELLPMGSSAAAAGQFLAWRAIDGQTEEVARFAKVGVPVAVRDEVD